MEGKFLNCSNDSIPLPIWKVNFIYSSESIPLQIMKDKYSEVFNLK